MTFRWATKERAFCKQPMCGIRFSILDCTLHTDTIHRAPGQIVTSCHVCAEHLAKPGLQEPMFFVEIAW